MAADKRVVVGGGFSALTYLATLTGEERSDVFWIRGPEGLSALGSGTIDIFEPLAISNSGLTRENFYSAMRLQGSQTQLHSCRQDQSAVTN